ncbi:Zinc finger and BTB domain-containing protein [Melia azedarach]|uniref:Zinc finger and BTB domain-containing protein n=1 Tax=Melia azedarach TaxID=155640 RepID=A0ACC1Z2N8_MELAZ|nr:Zinc finger and BTB domain-containing protein [Melia azedarach]
MLRMLSVMRRKSPRVADENMLSAVNGAHPHQNIPIFVHDLNNRRRRRRRGSSSGPGWNAFSLIYGVVRVPLSIISCFSQPHVNGADGVWVSGEFAQISEMNHLMVSDSMRYAILM